VVPLSAALRIVAAGGGMVYGRRIRSLSLSPLFTLNEQE
jgi:hypothetical protein